MKNLFRNLILGAFALTTALTARAALVAGDIALIGWFDNGTSDSFVFVTLADINAGETVYFTDNGWTGTQFRSVDGTSDGDGNESLLKWTALATIAAGRIINSTGTGADFIFTRTETIANGGTGVPGAATGQFSDLGFSTTGEQAYAFQAPTINPLFNPTTHLFVLDNSGTFENATNSNTGNITPGLSLGSTALTFNFAGAAFIAVNPAILAGPGKTKADWLSTFAISGNWTTGGAGTLPSGTIEVIPEPSVLLILASGVGVLLGRRRR